MKAILLTVTLVFAAAGAHAECTYPKAPGSIPNGNTATKEEMIAGMQAVKTYNTEMTAYLDCLTAEADKRIQEAGNDQDRVKKIKAVTNQRHDAALNELNVRANEFNSQLRIFNQKQKG